MDVEDLVALVTLALGVPAIVLQIVRELGRTTRRERLLQDIAIRDALGTDGSARKVMDEYLVTEVSALTGADSKRRDPLGIVLAVFFFLVGIGLAIAAFLIGGTWWLLAIPAGLGILFGIVGLAQDAPKRVRDERGRPV